LIVPKVRVGNPVHGGEHVDVHGWI